MPAKAPVPAFEAPPSVLMYGGTSSGLKTHLKDAEAVYLGVTGNEIALEPLVRQQLQAVLGIEDVDGFDFTQPVRFAVLDDTVFGTSSPLVLAMSADRTVLEPKLSGFEKTETGLSSTLPSGQVVDLAFVGNLAVLSLCGSEALVRHSAFMQQLMDEELQPGASFVFEMEHLALVHGADMKVAITQFKTDALEDLREEGITSPMQTGYLEAVYDLFSTAIDEGQRARAWFGFDAEGLSFDFDIAYKPASPTHELLASVTPTSHSSAARLPVGPGWAIGGIDRVASAPFVDSIKPWLARLTGMDSALFDEFLADETSMSMSSLPDGKLSLVGQRYFESTQRAEATHRLHLNMLEDPDYRSKLAKAQMSAKLLRDIYEIDGQPVSEIQVDFNQTLNHPHPAAAAYMTDLIGKSHSAVIGSSIFSTHGPDRKEVLQRIARSEAQGGLLSDPQVQAVLQQAAPASIFVMYSDLFGLAQLIPQAKPFVPILRSLGTSAFLHLSVGAPSGRVHFKIYASHGVSKAFAVAGQMLSLRRSLDQL